VWGCSNQAQNSALARPDHRAHHRPDQLADCSRAQNSESASQSDWKSAGQMLKGVFVWRYGPAAALVSLWGAHAPLNRSYQVVPSPPWPVLASPRSPVPSVLSDRARTACTGYEHSLVGAQEQRAHDDSSKAIMVQGAGPSLRIGRLPAVLPVGNPPAVAGVRGRQEAPRNLPRSLPAAIARCHGPACARPCARRTRGPTDLISLI
jgi:hypothetical protein